MILLDGFNIFPYEARAFPKLRGEVVEGCAFLAEDAVEIRAVWPRRFAAPFFSFSPDPFVLPNTLSGGFYLCLGPFDLI